MLKVFLVIIFIPFTVFAQHFTKVTVGASVNDGGDSRSVNWVDYNNDGYLDLFVSNGPSSRANNFLYKNNGDGTFTKITDVSVVNDPGSYDGSTWADYDNDGFIDAFTVTWYGQKNRLHRQRNGLFEKIISGNVANDNTYSETASWSDYDNDGYLDLYVANSAGNLANILYHNNGDGTFSKIVTGAIVTDAKISRSVSWCDFDNDGYVDLFVANEGNNNNSLYWNNGDGTFTAETAGEIVNDGGDSFGSSVGDINNDGYFDIFVANNSNQNNFLYINNGNRTFTKVSSGIVVNDAGYSIGSAFGDIDDDGDIDLFVTNGYSGTSQTKNFLYVNDGSGSFTKIDTGVVATDQGWSYGTALGDYDRDGDLDIFTANWFGANQNNSLYKNEGNGNSWLTMQLLGTVSNFSAIGARVKVKATVTGKPIWQVRQVEAQSGYCGENLEIHFGLGDAAIIDSLIIEWPSGQKTIQTNVGVKQHLKITEAIPSGFLRGTLQIEKFEEMPPGTILFKDISVSNPPVNSWKWDFNGDGITDATTSSANFNYAVADTYSVRLIVSNGINTDTVKSENSIIIPPTAAILQFSTEPHNFGTVDVNTPSKDTVVYIFNYGKLSDSISVSLIYGSSSSGTIKPDSALDVQPKSFVLAPGDSQAITFTVYPPSVIRTLPNVTYTPKIVVTSKFNAGQKIFEKSMWIKLQGTITDVEKNDPVPNRFYLYQNYPNPFNPTTDIRYHLPAVGTQVGTSEVSRVTLKVYDLLGREVKTVVNELKSPGTYTVNFDGSKLSSGIYIYQLRAGINAATKRMVLLK